MQAHTGVDRNGEPGDAVPDDIVIGVIRGYIPVALQVQGVCVRIIAPGEGIVDQVGEVIGVRLRSGCDLLARNGQVIFNVVGVPGAPGEGAAVVLQLVLGPVFVEIGVIGPGVNAGKGCIIDRGRISMEIDSLQPCATLKGAGAKRGDAHREADLHQRSAALEG